MNQSISAALQSSSLFKHLSQELLEHLANHATTVSFAAGENLIEEGKAVETLFLIVEGKIRVTTNAFGKIVDLKTMGAGDYVGEVSLLSGKMATASVQAESPTQAVAIGKDALLDVIDNDETLRKSLEHITLARAKDTLGKVLQ